MSDKKMMPVGDAFWTWVDSRDTPMQVASLMILRPTEPGVEFARRLLDSWREYPVTSRPFNYLTRFRPAPLPGTRETITDIDLEHHLRHSALPSPGGQRELGVLISRLHSAPLDSRRPLWEMHVIEGLEDNRVAIYLKAHHSLFDGIAGIRLMTETFTTKAAKQIPPPPWARPAKKRSPKQKLPSASMLKRLANVVQVPRALSTFALGATRPDDPMVGPFQAPQSALNVEIGPQRRISTAVLDLAKVKALATKSGTSLNDVVLAVCATALRRYLSELGKLPDQPLTAMCPVSVRTEGNDEGNAVSMILADLATNVSDPLKRLIVISASTRAGKDHLKTLDASVLADYAMLAGAPWLAKQIIPGASAVRPMFNLVISNVPGPRSTLFVGTARLEEFYPMSLLSKNEALNITILSYAGKLNFGFTACRGPLPHVQDVAVYAVEALDELEKALNWGGRK